MPRPLLLSALVVLVACRAAAAPTAPAILPPADFLDRHNAWADRLPHLFGKTRDTSCQFSGGEKHLHDSVQTRFRAEKTFGAGAAL